MLGAVREDVRVVTAFCFQTQRRDLAREVAGEWDSSQDPGSEGVHRQGLQGLQRGVSQAPHLLSPERPTCDRLLQLPSQPGGDQPVPASGQSVHRTAPGHRVTLTPHTTCLIPHFSLVVDTNRAIQFAIDVAKGMAFIHSLDRQLPRLYLNSHHIMVIINSCQTNKHNFSSDRLRVWWWAGSQS